MDHIYEHGDLVWVKTRRVGKVLPKATGPHTFLEYTGQNMKSAKILMESKEVIVSCIHLCPYF